MSTASTAFVSSIPSVTLSGVMQEIAQKAERLVKTSPERAPFKGFCILNLAPFLQKKPANVPEAQEGVKKAQGEHTETPVEDVTLTDVMPCSYLFGMSLMEATALGMIYVSGKFRSLPVLFHVCEVPCLLH